MNNLHSLTAIGPDLMLLLWTLVYPVLVIVCLINILQSTFKDPSNKMLWVLIVILMPIIGALMFLIIGHKGKIMDNAQPRYQRKQFS